MKKYIEQIIEIILEDVSCEHLEPDEFPKGPTFADVTYSLNDEKTVIEKCIKAIPARLIERPEITEKFIKKKAKELHDKLWKIAICDWDCKRQEEIRNFLCELLDELTAKISLIGKEES